MINCLITFFLFKGNQHLTSFHADAGFLTDGELPSDQVSPLLPTSLFVVEVHLWNFYVVLEKNMSQVSHALTNIPCWKTSLILTLNFSLSLADSALLFCSSAS